ncbi:MAG: hypothetical protein IT235_05495 [Bacteroidia bacterium]|nr:hypothetical protein [Bacteroidia bacterium]
MLRKKIKVFGIVILMGLAVLLVCPFFSCQKNSDCTAVITVIDTVGNTCAGASVRLYYDPGNGKGFVQSTQTTDGVGKTTFVFKLQAIFDVDVTFQAKLAKKAGIVTLQPGESVSKTITWK